MSALGDENVSRLDVAVDNASGMGCVEGIGDLDTEREDGFQLHRAITDDVLKGDAVEVFHDEEGAAGVLADVIDSADVGVVQGGGGLGFAAKSLERLAVLGEFFRQEFQGNEATETGVLGLVDDAHAAAAQLFDDAVVRDGLVEQRSVPTPLVSNAKTGGAGSQKEPSSFARLDSRGRLSPHKSSIKTCFSEAPCPRYFGGYAAHWLRL